MHGAIATAVTCTSFSPASYFIVDQDYISGSVVSVIIVAVVVVHCCQP